jgi:large subunit ribosomal protein L21
MYAIFRAQGKQFRAEPDVTLRLPSMDAEPGDKVTFEEVLLAERDGEVRVGNPALAGATVAAEIVRHGRGEKIVVYKMKRRKGYRRKQGHRQGFTEIRILDIGFPKGKAERPAPKAKDEAPAPKAKAKAPKAEAKPEKPAPKPKAEAAEKKAKAPVAEKKAPAKPAKKAAEPAEAKAEATAEVNITDAARVLAEEHGLDLTMIEGSGQGGRILKGDVDKAIKAKEAGE